MTARTHPRQRPSLRRWAGATAVRTAAAATPSPAVAGRRGPPGVPRARRSRGLPAADRRAPNADGDQQLHRRHGNHGCGRLRQPDPHARRRGDPGHRHRCHRRRARWYPCRHPPRAGPPAVAADLRSGALWRNRVVELADRDRGAADAGLARGRRQSAGGPCGHPAAAGGHSRWSGAPRGSWRPATTS